MTLEEAMRGLAAAAVADGLEGACFENWDSYVRAAIALMQAEALGEIAESLQGITKMVVYAGEMDDE